MNAYLKDKTNDFSAQVIEEVEKYNDDLKNEALDHNEEWHAKNQDNPDDDEESQ